MPAAILLACLVGAVPSMGDAAVVTKAQKLMDQAHQENAAAMQATNQAEYQKHMTNAADFAVQARMVFESADAADSDDTQVLMTYGDFLKEQGDYDLAEKTLLRAVSIKPNEPDLWFALGEAQGLLGPERQNRAVRSLRKALSLDPGTELDAKIHAALGAQFMQEGLFAFARKSLDAALKDDPNHVGARIALASLDVRDGEISKASDSLDALGNVSPQSAALMQRTMDTALVDFEASGRWMPDTAENHLAYAKLLVRAGRLADSVWPLERAVQLDPKNYVTWNLLGSVYRGIDKPNKAREAFSKSLEVNPDQPRTKAVLDELAQESSSHAPESPSTP